MTKCHERFVPTNEIWGFDSTSLEFWSSGWTFATLQGGSIFNLIPGTSVYQALLANYGELICNNPGDAVQITNVPNPSYMP